MRDEPHYGNNR